MTTTMTRMLTVTLMVLLPGGLALLALYMLGRTIVKNMRLEQGKRGQRFARAVSAIRFRDVWTDTRQQLRAS
jgi:hypothetical protein